MNPTLLILGFIAGRWWAIPAAMVAWPVALLLFISHDAGAVDVLGASGFAGANVAVGVVARIAANAAIRRVAHLRN